jgi:hypothetical protein
MSRAFLTLVIAASAALAVVVAPARAHADEKAFALVVAHNRSLDPGVPPLRYADDDGARFYEFIGSFAERARLLAVLDPATQRTFPELAQKAHPPTRQALREAMDELVAAMAEAHKAGHKTVFYFYFAGHGDVGQDREGYVNLVDGRFSRSDLFREVIARSGADLNHVIVDACNSYFLVNRRGADGKRSADEAIRSFLAAETLDRYPNTGVVLSTASMAESHEWSRYQSGIFSHQLLSALWGGADVDGDGRVDYAELSAYVAAANLRVRDPRARLAIHARPPRLDRRAPLSDLAHLRRVQPGVSRPAPGRVAAMLEVPATMSGHFYLEDDRGVRYVDFNKSAEQPLRLAMLDRPYYYLRTDDREALIKLAAEGGPAPATPVQAGALAFAEIPVRARGAVEESFRRDLYAFPFGKGFAAGHTAAFDVEVSVTGEGADVLPRAPAPAALRLSTWKWTSLAAGSAALAAGIALQVVSSQNQARLNDPAANLSFQAAHQLQTTANSQRLGAGVTFGVAGATLAASAVLFILDGIPARVGVSAGPGTGSLSFSGSF